MKRAWERIRGGGGGRGSAFVLPPHALCETLWWELQNHRDLSLDSPLSGGAMNWRSLGPHRPWNGHNCLIHCLLSRLFMQETSALLKELWGFFSTCF